MGAEESQEIAPSPSCVYHTARPTEPKNRRRNIPRFLKYTSTGIVRGIYSSLSQRVNKMKDPETSARYVNHRNGTQIGVETVALSDEDLVISLTPDGTRLKMDAWVVDEDDFVHVIPNAKVLRFEARGLGLTDLFGRAFAITGNSLMQRD